MTTYLLIKYAHVALALASGLGFALRGLVRIVLDQPLDDRVWKILPHVLDTLLLASGITLWALIGWPLVSWLGLKLMLVLAYIVLGMAAFRAARSTAAVGLYVLALLVFLAIPLLAAFKPF